MNDRVAGAPDAQPQRASDLLLLLANTWPQARISLGDIMRLLGERGYGLLMIVLALLGLVPGVSSIAAIPLTLVAAQLAIGLPRPWLPRFMAERSLSRADFANAVGRVAPSLARTERLLRPRLAVLTGPIGERLLGVMSLALALLLIIPILVNWPLVVPIVLISLALLERDGVFAMAGLAAGAVVLAVILGLGWVSIQEGLQLAAKYLGM